MSSHSGSYSFSNVAWVRPFEAILPLATSGKRFAALLDVVGDSHSADARIRSLIARVDAGLAAGFEPRLADEGTGGAYLMRDDAGVVVAIFKPSDEEPNTPNNPRGLCSPSPTSHLINHGFGRSHGAAELASTRDALRRGRASTMPTMADLFLLANRSVPPDALFGGAGHAAAPPGAPLGGAPRIRNGIAPGSSACREFAVFLLDHEHRAGVPLTMLAVVQHEAFHAHDEHGTRSRKAKIGSLQEFVVHDYPAEDLAMSKIRRFPVAAVHEIAVLDMRLGNTDRHGGNMLVRERGAALASASSSAAQTPQLTTPPPDAASDDGEHDSDVFGRLSLSVDSFDDPVQQRKRVEKLQQLRSPAPSPSQQLASEPQLIPIDHGLALPENLEEAWFEWLTWPQARVPFSAELKERIARLSWRDDCAVLRKFGTVFTRAVLRVLRVSYLLLQLGAAHDLTAHAIASIMCRDQLSEPSRLERAVTRAREHHMLLSSGGSAAPSDELSGAEEDDAEDDDEDDFFAVLEPILLDLVRRTANGGGGGASDSKEQHRLSVGFQFDDL